MLLDSDQCYRALVSHDSRFDGRFFVGVGSTGIYCRPVCTARTPLKHNCSFFPSAAAAEAKGYRPCLRCRPELAPGYAAVDANRRLAQSAARLIEDGRLQDASLAEVAGELQVTDRHLRRVFQQEFGVAPVEYAQTQRLLLAKRLLTDTDMAVLEVAMASGFASLRRFNDLFRTRYRMTPGELRKARARRTPVEKLAFDLAYRPPYDWDWMLGFLRKRAIAGVEVIEGARYRRTIGLGPGPLPHGGRGDEKRQGRGDEKRQGRGDEKRQGRGDDIIGWIEVSPAPRRAALRVVVSASLARSIPAVLSRVKALFDLACRPDEIAATLGPLAATNPGIRLPGAVDGFEIAVRAILGQQVTVKAATTVAGRIARAFGEPIETPHEGLDTLFPTAGRIAALTENDVARHGIIAGRARAILALARELEAGTLRLDPSADVDATLAALTKLPGIGPWTAHYIAMRALAWPDAFPHPDVAALKALRLTGARALAAAERWRPWRGYALMHLWKSLEEPT